MPTAETEEELLKTHPIQIAKTVFELCWCHLKSFHLDDKSDEDTQIIIQPARWLNGIKTSSYPEATLNTFSFPVGAKK